MPPKEITTKSARSAKTGQFTTKDYAKKHPATTVVETIKKLPHTKK